MSKDGFPGRRAVALADSQLRRNLGKATTTIRAKRADVGRPSSPDWEALRDAGAAIKAHAMATLPEQLERLEAAVTRAGGTVHWARDGAEANAIVAEVARAPRHARGHQGQVAGHGRDRPQRARSRRTGSTRSRPTSPSSSTSSPATGRRTSSCRRSTATGPRSGACSSGRSPKGASSTTTPEALCRGGAAAPAREVPRRSAVAVSGANFAVADTGTVCVFESEGNGRMCTTLPRVLVTVMGIEKVLPSFARPRGLRAAAAALLDRRADEPVHVVLDRRAPGDGPQEFHLVLLDNGRTRRARRRGRAPGAALHPLLGVPERLPGVLAHRRPRLRLDLPGPDRGDPHAAAARPRQGADAAVGVVAVRRLLRGLPGEDRHPDACSCTCAGASCARTAHGSATERAAMGAVARVFASRRRYETAQKLARIGPRAAREARRDSAPGLTGWTAMRELPEVPDQTLPRVVARSPR